MLGRISSFLSVKESEFSMFIWKAMFGAFGRAIAPSLGKHFLFMERLFGDPECKRLCFQAASLGLIKKRTSSWAYRIRKLFNPTTWKYFDALGAEEWDRYVRAISKRCEEIMETEFKDEE